MPGPNWEKRNLRASLSDSRGHQFYYRAWVRISRTHIRYLGRVQTVEGDIITPEVFFVLPIEFSPEDLKFVEVDYDAAGELLLVHEETDIGYAAGLEAEHNVRKEASKL